MGALIVEEGSAGDEEDGDVIRCGRDQRSQLGKS